MLYTPKEVNIRNRETEDVGVFHTAHIVVHKKYIYMCVCHVIGILHIHFVYI